jgi:hypothetical protein
VSMPIFIACSFWMLDLRVGGVPNAPAQRE